MIEMKPCAHCGCAVETGDPWLLHPKNGCILSGYEFGDWNKSLAENAAAWNRRQNISDVLIEALEEVRELFAPDVWRVVEIMQEGCGYPLARYAEDTELPEKRVKEIVRALAAFGLAEHGQFHSEDDNYIRGSGYWLTRKGVQWRSALAKIDDALRQAKGGSDAS